MFLFKISLTFFFLFLMTTIVLYISLPDAYDRRRLEESEKVVADRLRKWWLRSGIATIITFWLAIVGLIWH